MPIEKEKPETPDSDRAGMVHIDALLDEALEEASPASDPIAVDSGELPWNRGYAVPQGLVAFRRLRSYADGCGLEHSLLELVKTRASQINGCAYCIDMHTQEARRAGESGHRPCARSA